MIYDALVLPFIEFAFMQRALSGTLMLSLSAVFAENISDARLVEQIASEAGLELGGTLYSDALSSADGPAPRYIDMMHYNVETFAAAINNG